MPASLEHPHPLVRLRTKLGWSQARYARELDAVHRALGLGGMPHERQKIYRWESKRVVPDPSAQRAIAALHGIPDHLRQTLPWPQWLAAACTETDRGLFFGNQAVTVEMLSNLAKGGPVDRRKFLIMSSAALGASITDWQDALGALLSPSPNGRRRISAVMVDHIETRLDRLRHLDDALGSTQLRNLSMAEFAFVTSLIQDAHFDEPTGRRLYAAAAEAARICAWVHFDDGYQAQAEQYFDAALRTSAIAGDALIGAYALSFRAIQHYTAGDPRDAVALLEAAQAQTRHTATPRFRAMLAARAARSHSIAGDQRACARALHQARDLLAIGPRDDDPPYLYWVDLGEIEMIAGSSALQLGDPREALRRFDAAIAANYDGDDQYPRTHAIYLARAADAHLALRDLDQAVAVAEHAVRCLGGVDSARSSATLDALRSRLSEHRNVAVVRRFLDLTA